MISKVPLSVKTAALKFDYALRIFRFSATSYLVTHFEGQTYITL